MEVQQRRARQSTYYVLVQLENSPTDLRQVYEATVATASATNTSSLGASLRTVLPTGMFADLQSSAGGDMILHTYAPLNSTLSAALESLPDIAAVGEFRTCYTLSG